MLLSIYLPNPFVCALIEEANNKRAVSSVFICYIGNKNGDH